MALTYQKKHLEQYVFRSRPPFHLISCFYPFSHLKSSLNACMGLGPPFWKEARETITRLLPKDESVLRDNKSLQEKALLDVCISLPHRFLPLAFSLGVSLSVLL